MRRPRPKPGAIGAARGVRGGLASVRGALAAQRGALGRLRAGQGDQAARDALRLRPLVATGPVLLRHRLSRPVVLSEGNLFHNTTTLDLQWNSVAVSWKSRNGRSRMRLFGGAIFTRYFLALPL